MLRADLLGEANAAVKSGIAPNLSAFVEQAVEEKLRRTKRSLLYAAYEEAARDPAFMADMASVTEAFALVDNDGLSAPRR